MPPAKPHPEDLVHRTTLRIPYPLLDEIDAAFAAAMKSGELPRSASRNEFLVKIIGDEMARRSSARPRKNRP